MRYRSTKPEAQETNPWASLVAKLNDEANPPPAPRKLSLWQYYMGKNREAVNAVFDERWPLANLPDSQVLNFRGSIARELVNQESEEVQERLQQEIEAMHAVDEQLYAEESSITMGVAQDEDAQAR